MVEEKDKNLVKKQLRMSYTKAVFLKGCSLIPVTRHKIFQQTVLQTEEPASVAGSVSHTSTLTQQSSETSLPTPQDTGNREKQSKGNVLFPRYSFKPFTDLPPFTDLLYNYVPSFL